MLQGYSALRNPREVLLLLWLLSSQTSVSVSAQFPCYIRTGFTGARSALRGRWIYRTVKVLSLSLSYLGCCCAYCLDYNRLSGLSGCVGHLSAMFTTSLHLLLH
ncbi:unnamed protein product [Ectocarpus sp. 13 AM-2016]